MASRSGEKNIKWTAVSPLSALQRGPNTKVAIRVGIRFALQCGCTSLQDDPKEGPPSIVVVAELRS